MLKETEKEKIIALLSSFLSLVAFQLGGRGRPPALPGYAYELDVYFSKENSTGLPSVPFHQHSHRHTLKVTIFL